MKSGRRENLTFNVSPRGWGFCLFSLNLSPKLLDFYTYPEDSRQTLLESLTHELGQNCPERLELFGVHDFIGVFQRADPVPSLNPALIDDESERPSVIQGIGQWVSKLEEMKGSSQFETMLARATEKIWTNYFPALGLQPSEVDDVRKAIRSFKHGAQLKAPTLYNYTYDSLIPLYLSSPTPESLLTADEESEGIVAFSFLRLDPRVLQLRTREAGNKDYWYVYDRVLQYLRQEEKQVKAVWTGIGMSQLVVMVRCESFSELARFVNGLRDGNDTEIPGYRNYSTVTNSSTLISVPKTYHGALHEDDKHIAFYLLIKVWSGYHGDHTRIFIKDLAGILGIRTETTVGGRQGMFDLIVRVQPGTPYKKIRQLSEILDSGCPFVEDLVSVVSLGENDPSLEKNIEIRIT